MRIPNTAQANANNKVMDPTIILAVPSALLRFFKVTIPIIIHARQIGIPRWGITQASRLTSINVTDATTISFLPPNKLMPIIVLFRRLSILKKGTIAKTYAYGIPIVLFFSSTL